MSPSRRSISLCAFLLLTGCASTKVENTGTVPKQTLCQAKGENLFALVLWGAQWRPDQREVPTREAAAQRGIDQFFADSACYSKVAILSTVQGRAAIGLSDQEALQLASNYRPRPARIIVITVKELGPVARVARPTAVAEGPVETVLQIRALGVNKAESLGNFKSTWRSANNYAIKNSAALEQDMRSALEAALARAPARP